MTKLASMAVVLALLVPAGAGAPAVGGPRAGSDGGVRVTAGAGVVAPPSLDITSKASSRLPAPPSAPDRGPAADERGLVFTPDGAGFLVSSTALVPTGAANVAEVQRTRDQGESWVTVWRRSGGSLSWVGAVNGEVLAAGISASDGPPFMIDSSDGGTSWQVVHVRLSPSLVTGVRRSYVGQALDALWAHDQFEFVTPSLGFAVPDSMMGQAYSSPGLPALLRTTDGGRTWQPVFLPGGTPTGGLVLTGGGRGFATGEAPECGQIWQTTDYGARWSAVPGTCVHDWLDALSFPTPSEVFAAGGEWAKYTATGHQRLDLFRTTDGGRHWAKVYEGVGPPGPAGDDNPFGEIDFVSPQKGFALDGGQVASGNGPLGGHLWLTTDGGRHWAEREVEGLRLVISGQGDVWLVGGGPAGGSDVMWRSLDGGRTWSEVGNPARTAVHSIAGSGWELWVGTEAGQFVSNDAGRTWHPAPSAMEQAYAAGGYNPPSDFGPGGLVLFMGPDNDLWWSDDGGRAGRALKVPGLAQVGLLAAAFANRDDGLAIGGSLGSPVPVLSTQDGGSTWHLVGKAGVAPASLAFDGPVAIAGGLGNTVSLSYDRGYTWYDLALGSELSTAVLSVSAAGTSVAVLCYLISTGREYMLLSVDGGRHWAKSTFIGPGAKNEPGGLLLSGTHSLWAYGPPGMLWHTTNAGRTWTTARLLLPLSS